MKKLYYFVILQVFIFQIAKSQGNYSTTISANNIEAEINSDGSLSMSFNNTALPGEDAQISTLKSSGLWCTGLDPDGNIVGSIQIENEDDKTDFQTHPNFQNIWKVSNGEINKHRNDWADNMIIDDPQSTISDWPIDALNTGGRLANFWDNNGTGVYSPEHGDYPIIGVRGCSANTIFPNEMVFSAFTDEVIHTQSNLEQMNLDFGQTVFAFNCTDSDVLNNTIFVHYKFIYNGAETLTNVSLGMYNDFQIGCNQDDFIGSMPERGIQYAYNATNEDCEEGFANNPPVHAIQFLRGPHAPKIFGSNNELLDPPIGQYPDTLVLTEPSIFLPIGHEDSNINFPNNGLDYFNLMRGMIDDGIIIQNINALYTGDPTDANAISELSENNTPGDRKTITAFDSFTLYPGSVNEFVVAHTIYGGGSTTIDEALQEMLTNTEVEDAFDNCFDAECIQTVTSTKAPINVNALNIYPNPATDQVYIEFEDPIESINLYNVLGQNIPVRQNNNSIEVSSLASGNYIIELISNGNKYIEKLLVSR